MPDPQLRSLSATELPALWHRSPYATRWMLYQRFAKGANLDSPGNNRMDWGTKMQPLLLDEAARDYALEIRPNNTDQYVRSGRLGCTRDSEIIAPDRGPGVLEAKVVFDYRVWMDNWGGGDKVPEHIELQVQQQMLVGDGTTPFKWGVIAVWLAGEMHYFDREPLPELWDQMRAEADGFFSDVANGNEPPVTGMPVEIPLLQKFWRQKGKEIDSDDVALRDMAVRYSQLGTAENEAKKERADLRGKLLAACGDAERVYLPGGSFITLKDRVVKEHMVGESKSVTLKVTVQDTGEKTDEELAAEAEAIAKNMSMGG